MGSSNISPLGAVIVLQLMYVKCVAHHVKILLRIRHQLLDIVHSVNAMLPYVIIDENDAIV